MDEFNYLTVLVSIILGLGITQLLTGLGRLLQNRARVKLYWPTLGSVATLLVTHVLIWWTLFEMRAEPGWTFLGFLSVLLVPIVLYLLSAIVLPDFSDSVPDDLREHYYANARWYFGLLVVLVAATFLRELVLEGEIDLDLDSASKVLFAVLFAIAAVTRRARFHEILVPVNLALLIAYIATLFPNLPKR